MEKDTSRIEAFSDGIFAVAITLLALDIGVDIKDMQAVHPLSTTTNKELIQQLIAEWPKIFTYFNSFAAVLLMWMFHHQIFKLLRTTSVMLMLFNGLLLLVIALVPFPTKTLGEFIGTSAQKTAVAFYTGYSVIVSSVFIIFVQAARTGNNKLFLPNVDAKTIQRISAVLWIGVSINMIIFLLSFKVPIVALILNFSMWIFWAYVSRGRNE
jgi:uncharacterized membrane protein